MFNDLPLLSLLIWLPVVGGLITLTSGDRDSTGARRIALAFSIATLLLCIPLYTNFSTTTADMQFEERVVWIEAFNIFYHMGVDGISMPLIILTAFITPLVVIAGWKVIQVRASQYMAAFLIMEGLMIGVFSALDAMLFYVFWEAMLIPMFLIIGVWGGPNRIYATIKFFLYTFLGSVLMLVALIYMHYQSETGSFAILDYHSLKLGMTEQKLIFLAFLLAFAVKVPMWPVHTWLPDAHVEAPTGGSVILAAIMLKIGGYGFLRFSLPIAPDASASLDWLIIAMSLIAVTYIGLVAMVQVDMKKLIAYSSIAHMGFVTLGFFLPFSIYFANGNDLSGAALAVEGGMVQMISHGLDYGGVVISMPIFASFMVLFALANSGLPGTSGFVGEFMVILASVKSSFWIALVAATTLILGAAYSLWLVKRVVFGKITNEKVADMQDLDRREFVVLGSLAFTVLLFGVWPDPLVEVMHPTIDNLLRHIIVSKI
jgi:NADH-quinone oxidoreductase subunit M